MSGLVKRIFTGMGLAALCAGSLLAGQKPFEQLVPESSTFFLSIRNMPEASRWLLASPLSEVWKSPEMEKFVKGVTSLIESKMTPEEKELGNTFSDWKEICQGEVALALGDLASFNPEEEGKKLTIAMLVDVGEKKEKARQFMSKEVEEFTRKGKTRRTENEFRGQKIVALERSESDKKDGDALAICLADDLLVMSSSRPFLQDILANRGEPIVKPLSEQSEYRSLREKHGKDAAVFLYMPLGRWLEFIPRAMKASKELNTGFQAGIFTQVMDYLGFSSVRALSGSWTLSEDKIKQTLFLLAPGAPKGLLKLLWTKPQPLRFPPLIPDDVEQCTVLQLDFEALLKMVEDAVALAASMTGQHDAEGQPNPLKQAERMLGVNFRQDLIAPLSGQVIEYERARRPDSQETPESCVMIELKDKEKLKATFDQFFSRPPFMTLFKKAEYLGRSLYVFGPRAFGEGDGSEGDGEKNEKRPALGFTDTHLIFGTDRNIVEEVIRRVGKEVKSVVDSPGFKEVASGMPPEAIFLSYQSTAALEHWIHLTKELASQAGGGDLDDDDDEEDDAAESKSSKSGAKKGEGESFKELLKKLPDASVFTKHVGGLLSSGFTEEGGIGIRSSFFFKKKGDKGK